uniref:Uncharacterized protein n=1 Tax=Oryza meridionalis TaxID=40149 RepID=A0A0E0C0Z5_9ORYZ
MAALRLATRPSPRGKTPWGAAPSAPRAESSPRRGTRRRAPPHTWLSSHARFKPTPGNHRLACIARRRIHHFDARTHVAARLVERVRGRMSSSRLDTRTLKEEVASMDKRWLVDLGHPLVNRVADSFIRAAGVGAARAVSREAYFVTVEGLGGDTAGLDNAVKRSNFTRGDDGQKSLDAVVKSAGKEAFQWGLAAGKNSAVAGAIAGVAVALTGDTGNADHMVHFAITGAALSSAASLLSGIY